MAASLRAVLASPRQMPLGGGGGGSGCTPRLHLRAYCGHILMGTDAGGAECDRAGHCGRVLTRPAAIGPPADTTGGRGGGDPTECPGSPAPFPAFAQQMSSIFFSLITNFQPSLSTSSLKLAFRASMESLGTCEGGVGAGAEGGG